MNLLDIYLKCYRGVYDMILDSNRLIASVYDTIQVWDLSTYQMINLLNPKSLDSPNAATTCFAVLRDKLVNLTYAFAWFAHFVGKRFAAHRMVCSSLLTWKVGRELLPPGETATMCRMFASRWLILFWRQWPDKRLVLEPKQIKQ